MKTENQLKDLQGQVLQVGDRVAFASYHNLGLTIGTVQKIGRLRAEVTPVKCRFKNIVPKVESFRTNDLIKL
jgi:hypothetical protein